MSSGSSSGDKANVASVEAIEAFRSQVVLWLERAGQSLAEAQDEVSRTRNWLHSDRRTYWINEAKRRKRALDDAEAELYNLRLSSMQDSAARVKMQVRRCRAAFAEAEEKIRAVKKWSREFDSRVEPLSRKLNHLDEVVNNRMPLGAGHLAETLRLLSDYAAPGSSAKAGDSEASDTPDDSSDGEQV